MQRCMPEYVFKQSTLTMDNFYVIEIGKELRYKKKVRHKPELSNIWLLGVPGKTQKELGAGWCKKK